MDDDTTTHTNTGTGGGEPPIRLFPPDRLLPRGFDPGNPKHMVRLTTMVQEAAANDPTWDRYELLKVDATHHRAVYKLATLPDKADAPAEHLWVDPSDVNEPARRRRMARDRYEPEYPGFVVTDFDTSDPTRTLVTLTALDEATLAARRIFANVFGIDPWDMALSRTPDNGWKIQLKPSANRVWTSRYDKPMREAVTEQVGQPGWFYKADPSTGIVMVHPGVPPTFPRTIPMPPQVWERPDVRRSPFGMRLPDNGRVTGDILANDWKDGAFVLVCGESNGGKSVTIDSLVFGRIVAGCRLVVVDDEGKSGDYRWCRPWVMDDGWGCDGLESAAAALNRLLQIVDERGRVWNENGWTNWWELPPDARREYPPILLVADEIPQLAVPAPKPPAGTPKDDPVAIRTNYENACRYAIADALLRITQKARYVGVTGVYATQSAVQQAGVPTLMRSNLPSKILVGEKVPEATRVSALKDARTAPKVPLNVIRDGVGKGTGVAELVGQEACVYKSFFEEERDGSDTVVRSWPEILRARAMGACPAPGGEDAGRMGWDRVMALFPTAAQRPDDGSRFVDDDGAGADGGDGDGDGPVSRLEAEGGFGVDGRDVADRDAPLRGAAAAHASRLNGVEELRRLAALSAQKGM